MKFTDDPKTIPASVLRRHEYGTSHKTVVVIGLPQGGTSVLAAVVDALGVPMARPGGLLFNFEGQEERPCVTDAWEAWKAKAVAWNQRADAWGLKDTIIWRFTGGDVQSALRNPYFIIAQRDTAAIMQRRAANHAVVQPQHLLSVIEQVVDQQAGLWRFVRELSDCPMLVVSYERALKDSETTCRLVTEFLGLTPTLEQSRLAVARVSKTGGYLVKDGTDGT